MKTSSLIDLLSQDTPNAKPQFRFTFSCTFVVSVGLIILFFMLFLTLRSDFGKAVLTSNFMIKLSFTLSLTVLLGLQTYKSISPTHKISSKWFFAPLVLLTLAFLFEADKAKTLLALPKSSWSACLFFIPTLSLLSLIPFLWVLKNGASANPSLSGLTIGGFCGALGASFYAFHCTEDSSLFVLVFYSLGILTAALVGGLVGKKVLKW
jgi:hypothetical protein